MADTRIVCPMCTVISSRARLDISGLVVSVSDFGTRGKGSIPGWALITNCFFFLFFCRVIQNNFKQVIWNYINDNSYNP